VSTSATDTGTDGSRMASAPVVTGCHLVAGQERGPQGPVFRALHPRTGETGSASFGEATPQDLADAATAADEAFQVLRTWPGARRGELLRRIAAELEAISPSLIKTADAETALGAARLTGELGRACGQLRAFADLVEEGSYVDAIIDPADPGATPPRPDLRRLLVPVGPVAVFGASNFPFAFSVPGGDTAAALAAGCPTLVKAHPAHPATSELCGRAILAAVRAVGAPVGTFSLLQGRTPDVGRSLVLAPQVKAVGFTGSTEVGRALFDLAARRPDPIPVYAEMGSINPVFLTPGALADRGAALAEEFVASMTLSTGQFCTSPGLVLLPDDERGSAFLDRVGELLRSVEEAPMLTEGIRAGLHRRLTRTAALPGVQVVVGGGHEEAGGTSTAPTLLHVGWDVYERTPELLDEHFGPAAVVVNLPPERYVDAARRLKGNLTATVHGTADEAAGLQELQAVLVEKAGRVIWNGFPTGVAVTAAQHHGGPYPATTFPAYSSVGVTAVLRFLRPVAFQDAPAVLLPPELRDDNPLGIPRRVAGVSTREPVGGAG
jgi:acyl-CoA reductase-like NAD-dependent aldehyde dehydrogenase